MPRYTNLIIIIYIIFKMSISDEVGYTGTSSYSKYGDWYGYQGGWCTTFVLWCFNKAGKQNGVTLNGVIIPRGGNCSSMISWFKDKGRYYSPSKYTPKSGDLIFFDWTGCGTADHGRHSQLHLRHYCLHY